MKNDYVRGAPNPNSGGYGSGGYGYGSGGYGYGNGGYGYGNGCLLYTSPSPRDS